MHLSQDPTRCRYFNWADEPLKPPGAAGGGAGGGGSGNGTCFSCGQTGKGISLQLHSYPSSFGLIVV